MDKEKEFLIDCLEEELPKRETGIEARHRLEPIIVSEAQAGNIWKVLYYLEKNRIEGFDDYKKNAEKHALSIEKRLKRRVPQLHR